MFEWDERKRQEVLHDRGVDLLDAALIFEDPERVLVWRDGRKDYGEDRFIAVGMVEEIAYQLVFTWRGEAMRLITAWKISNADYEKYKTRLAQAIEGDEGTR